MIFLSKNTADADNGQLILRNFQVTGDYKSSARVSKTKLLDGSTHVENYGVSDLDRDLTIDCRLSMAERAALRALHQDSVEVRISYWDGAYNGYVSKMRSARDGVTKIVFDFTEKLT